MKKVFNDLQLHEEFVWAHSPEEVCIKVGYEFFYVKSEWDDLGPNARVYALDKDEIFTAIVEREK